MKKLTKKEIAKKEILASLKVTGAEASIKDLSIEPCNDVSVDTIRSAVKELVEEGKICKLIGKKRTARYFFTKPARNKIVLNTGNKKRGWKIAEARRIFSQEDIRITREALGEILEMDSKNTHMMIAHLRAEGFSINYDSLFKMYEN